MECIVCSFTKLARDFPISVMSAKAAPRTLSEYPLPFGQLLFACLDCLVTKTDLMKHALEARTISVETHEPLFDEVAEWQQWKSQQYSATSASGDSDDRSFIRVSLLASSYRISINANTTVKDVKVELGRLIDRNPPSIRLMFHGTDVKVKKAQTLMLLSAYNIHPGDRLEALLPISRYAGQSVINALGVGKDGNALGAEADLGQSGGFKGMKIIFIDLHGQCSDNVQHPLDTMGFAVDYRRTIPPPAELRDLLNAAHQLWVISDHTTVFGAEVLEIINVFHQHGGALYIWGDNEPFYAAANSILSKILPGISLLGNYVADQKVNAMVGGKGPGFIAHPIFTGISNLYEGITIARFVGEHPRVQYIMNSSEGQPCLGICDVCDSGGSGRIAVDVGFTKLFYKWDSDGTARFVSNIAAWLCSPDSDWM